MMGMGDEIMVTGQVKRAQQTDPRRVQVVDRDGVPRWHPIWESNPRIARPGEQGDFQLLRNGPGARPYIADKKWRCWTWRAFECTPGEICLTDAERSFAAPHRPQIVIEPTLKARASPNKHWGTTRWEQFAALAHQAGYRLTQLGPRGTRPLPHVALIETPDFRSACAVLANAQIYIGHEGGLHHAAAAFGIPAVVIFGGFISPAQTGYDLHRNLFSGGEPCGMRIPCAHCAAAMAAITPEMVLEQLCSVGAGFKPARNECE